MFYHLIFNHKTVQALVIDDTDLQVITLDFKTNNQNHKSPRKCKIFSSKNENKT